MAVVGQTPQEEVEATQLAIIEGQPTAGKAETESSEEFATAQVEEREKSHDVCLELCDDIRDVILQIQREVTGLFNVPRLRAVDHRYKLMGIYNNLEKLYAQIDAGK